MRRTPSRPARRKGKQQQQRQQGKARRSPGQRRSPWPTSTQTPSERRPWRTKRATSTSPPAPRRRGARAALGGERRRPRRGSTSSPKHEPGEETPLSRIGPLPPTPPAPASTSASSHATLRIAPPAPLLLTCRDKGHHRPHVPLFAQSKPTDTRLDTDLTAGAPTHTHTSRNGLYPPFIPPHLCSEGLFDDSPNTHTLQLIALLTRSPKHVPFLPISSNHIDTEVHHCRRIHALPNLLRAGQQSALHCPGLLIRRPCTPRSRLAATCCRARRTARRNPSRAGGGACRR